MKDLLQKYLGALILVGAMVFAVVQVVRNQLSYEASDVTTIKICHWQLEAGFRASLDQLIKDYETHYYATHGEKIRVLQVPISERGYRQYVNTGLIGGTAPDIIEKGMAKGASEPAYVARYFLPLGAYLKEPNPYNQGTALEGVPWADTFFDGMQGAYDRNLLDYYFIPFSMFTMRIYYNKELFEKVIGPGNPPKTYQEFLDVCKRVRDYADKTSEIVVPIAGSKAQGGYFSNLYGAPFMFELIRQVDENQDGNADVFETYRGYKNKVWSFQSPRLVASWDCLVEIAKNFQDGWLAAQRDDALFMFIQQRALMIASGSWDASSIIQQAGDNFTVGIFDFPMPTDHPVYSKYVKGPASEASIGGGIPWSITKQSRHADLCIDFLRFCTTKDNNERFDSNINWLPVVRGAALNERLKPFKPRVEGFSGQFKTDISTASKLISAGARWPLLAGKISTEEFGRRVQEVYEKTAVEGYEAELEKLRRNNRNLDRILASIMLRAQVDPANSTGRLNEKILQLLQSSQTFGHQYAVNQAALQAEQQKAED
jgi:raffinose/stachyose/melibiose transport system substrate-binding protein